MARIVRWLVVALLLFFGITEGLPWIRGWVEGITEDKVTGRPTGVIDDASMCVHLAHRVSAFAGQEIGRVTTPPTDSPAWVEATYEIRDRIGDADRACTCPSSACDKARQALAELRGLVDDVDRLIGGDARLVGTLARRQEQIDVLLEQARALSR
jgi:hypothetical protein